jgi:hypothetical protein
VRSPEPQPIARQGAQSAHEVLKRSLSVLGGPRWTNSVARQRSRPQKGPVPGVDLTDSEGQINARSQQLEGFRRLMKYQ